MPATAAFHSADAHISLRDQIARLIGVPAERLTRSRCRPWSSVRFSGTRHEFLFACADPIDRGAAYRVKAHEFTLDGEIVADASLALADGVCRVEALTVEAR